MCSVDSRAVCVNLSSAVGILVEKAWKAMQLACNDCYEDEVFLTKNDAIRAMEKSSGDESLQRSWKAVNKAGKMMS